MQGWLMCLMCIVYLHLCLRMFGFSFGLCIYVYIYSICGFAILDSYCFRVLWPGVVFAYLGVVHRGLLLFSSQCQVILGQCFLALVVYFSLYVLSMFKWFVLILIFCCCWFEFGSYACLPRLRWCPSRGWPGLFGIRCACDAFVFDFCALFVTQWLGRISAPICGFGNFWLVGWCGPPPPRRRLVVMLVGWWHRLSKVGLFIDFVGCVLRAGADLNPVDRVHETQPSLQVPRAETRVERFTARQHVLDEKKKSRVVTRFGS